MANLEDLLDDIFDGKRPALYVELERWLRDSRRFRAFTVANRGKIRAKLRSARDESGMKDVRAELETAALLLRDERFTLEYEKYAALKQRGPDFTVTFKTHTPFNVEVRRIRGGEFPEPGGEALIGKLTGALCDKVGQMPPSIVNLLWLTAEGNIPESELTRAVATLRQQAELKVEDYFTRRGYESAVHFLRQFSHLSGVVLRQPGANVLWLNPLARHKVPPEIATAIRRLR